MRLLPFLLAFTTSVLAYPQISSPAAGSSIPAGTITVKWTDNGEAPSISQLQTYTMTLFAGGNNAGVDSLGLFGITTAATKFTSSNTITATIDPALTATLQNGFYLQMVATAKDGGVVTLYSDRFTLTGMSGAPLATKYRSAVTALGGASAGPADVNAVSNAAAPAPAAAAPAPAGAFNIPYNKQEGATKYAPMQGIPPNKISLKKFSPMFPTSAYTVAKTWMPQPTILTTLTETQTFSVRSSINTAAPQSLPTGNSDPAARFLARWKD